MELVQVLRHPVAIVSLLVTAAILAGCTDSAPKALPETPKVELPSLPWLKAGLDVAVDLAHRGGEPSIAVDSKGHLYVTAPSGMVSTIFNSVVDPTIALAQGPQNRQSFIWKSEAQGVKDSWKLLTVDLPVPPPSQLPPIRDNTFGGADTDVAIDACDNVYFTDLWLGNIAVSHSKDGGKTWVGTPITGHQPILDRQWLATIPGDKSACGTVYLAYQTFYSQVYVIKSTDFGLTWTQQTKVMDCATTGGCYAIDGNIVVDPMTKNVYLVMGGPNGRGTLVAASTDGGKKFEVHTSSETKNDINNIFPVIAVDAAGGLYVVWSEYTTTTVGDAEVGSYNVMMVRSETQGKTWTEPKVVSGDVGTGTEVFPWVAAGAAGRVAVAWIAANETVKATDDVKGDWYVYVNTGIGVGTANETWTGATKFSSEPMHKGEICTLGLGCTLPKPVGTRGNRNLADFFEIAIDVQGNVVAAWPNDYKSADQFVSFPYFGMQVDGVKLLDLPAVPAPAGNMTQ